MKFLLFSDFHYYPGYFKGGSFEWLHEIQKCAEAENVDFIIHAGDLTHGPSEHIDFMKEYNDFHIPSYNCLGNHDTDNTPLNETLRLYNMPGDYYYFDNNGYRIIVMNPNQYRLGDEYIKYSMGNYYAHPDERDWVDNQQLMWLKETLEASPHPSIIISHESFEREADGVHNQNEVRDIINKANNKRPGSVLMCINGHQHRDFMRILDNVCYFEINSTSYDWVENEHFLYPKEELEKIKYLKNTVCYNDPVFAIVTLTGNTIDIKGRESTLYMGITREMTGNQKCDLAGRMVTPKVMSAKITLR